jgi:hypothetical protein
MTHSRTHQTTRLVLLSFVVLLRLGSANESWAAEYFNFGTYAGSNTNNATRTYQRIDLGNYRLGHKLKIRVLKDSNWTGDPYLRLYDAGESVQLGSSDNANNTLLPEINYTVQGNVGWTAPQLILHAGCSGDGGCSGKIQVEEDGMLSGWRGTAQTNTENRCINSARQQLESLRYRGEVMGFRMGSMPQPTWGDDPFMLWDMHDDHWQGVA